jgi:hypothetical protein
LRKISCDNRIATEQPYRTTALWSRALHDHPDQSDGIIYRSWHNPRFKCLALFDRRQTDLAVSNSEPLMIGARRHWTTAQITKYHLAIEPAI